MNSKMSCKRGVFGSEGSAFISRFLGVISGASEMNVAKSCVDSRRLAALALTPCNALIHCSMSACEVAQREVTLGCTTWLAHVAFASASSPRTVTLKPKGRRMASLEPVSTKVCTSIRPPSCTPPIGCSPRSISPGVRYHTSSRVLPSTRLLQSVAQRQRQMPEPWLTQRKPAPGATDWALRAENQCDDRPVSSEPSQSRALPAAERFPCNATFCSSNAPCGCLPSRDSPRASRDAKGEESCRTSAPATTA
mmetsp:Transcript_10271/g.31897  ORF Transcript_10271/g.31897 Transcript_10271/m.31897 type:complete len:251 (-) Transcript_10271:2287-3039(-)